MNLEWNMLQSREHLETFLRSGTLRRGLCISHYIFSSTWSSIKSEFQETLNNFSYYIIGNGDPASSWKHTWCGIQPLAQTLEIHDAWLNGLDSRFVIS